MKMKIGIGAGVVLVLGYLFATPYITAYQMKVAAENQDGEALSEFVDFPALRESLKDQMAVRLRKEMAEDVFDGNPLSAIGTAFGGMIVKGIVDEFVTPAGLMQLMKGKRPDSETYGGEPTGQTPSGPFSDISTSYESFSKFSIITRDPASDLEVEFILRRRGIQWKLTEVILPIN